MGAYILSVGGFKMKLQTGKQVRAFQNDYHVHLDELGLYKTIATVKQAVTAGLVRLIAQYAQRQAEKLKLEIEDYPPHSIFCECKGCIPKNWIVKHRYKKGS